MRVTARAQGAFYVATGLWPVVHLRSFEAVTGTKRDGWLVQTTGGLIAGIGAALLVGARERTRPASLVTLGLASAVTLGVADLVFVARGRIPPVYLGDAVAEAALIGGWIAEGGLRSLW